jgi:hypothetical protein
VARDGIEYESDCIRLKLALTDDERRWLVP